MDHKEDGSPLFLMLSFQGVHTPLQVREPNSQQFIQQFLPINLLYYSLNFEINFAFHLILLHCRQRRFLVFSDVYEPCVEQRYNKKRACKATMED